MDHQAMYQPVQAGQQITPPLVPQPLAQHQPSPKAETSGKRWTGEEDRQLTAAVNSLGKSEWKNIAQYVPTRNHVQCFHRWTQTLMPGSVKGVWQQEEDTKLKQLVTESDNPSWRQIAEAIPGRNTKQCRERWKNFLNPILKKGKWQEEEDKILLEEHQKVGNRWASIARMIIGRTKLQVRDRWRALEKRKENKETKSEKLKVTPLPAAEDSLKPTPQKQKQKIGCVDIASTQPMMLLVEISVARLAAMNMKNMNMNTSETSIKATDADADADTDTDTDIDTDTDAAIDTDTYIEQMPLTCAMSLPTPAFGPSSVVVRDQAMTGHNLRRMTFATSKEPAKKKQKRRQSTSLASHMP